MFWSLFKKKKKSTSIPLKSAEMMIDKKTDVDMIPLKIKVSISTNPGCIRQDNEDNYFATGIGCKTKTSFSNDYTIEIGQFGVFSIFDGMGGESYGEEASRIAAETLNDFSERLLSDNVDEKSIKSNVEQYIAIATNRISDMISKRKCNCSGCTMAMVVIYREMVYAFSIGDSRIYRICDDVFIQISEDQTLALKKLKANIYTKDEARNNPDSHKITSYIGLNNRGVGVPYLSYSPFPLSDSVVLLCSDGLTDMCNDDEILTVISTTSNEIADRLSKLAIKNGGEDNITCIVIQKAK